MTLDVQLIYDNESNALRVPAAMGTPAPDQLRGSPVDNLVELAGRVCYDSLGKGRSSADYHQHNRDVGHLSVLEHAAFTVEVDSDAVSLVEFLNKPSLWVEPHGTWCRVTLNLRHVAEWPAGELATTLRGIAATLAPLASPRTRDTHLDGVSCRVAPSSPQELWASLYIGGVSRGLTHELVRHGDYTAISQRSTRYCDETHSPHIWHPDLAELAASDAAIAAALNGYEARASALYDTVAARLYDRTGDRKAARGAARGVLGNALETSLIFSANLAQWRHIIALRIAPAADGEIRRWAGAARDVLRQRFGGDAIP